MTGRTERIGFIGLGDQGEPMAHRIAEAGWPLTLWARRAASLDPFAGTAATIAASPAELARQVDMVCLCTFGEADLEELLFGRADGVAAGLTAGQVLIIHNTVSPQTCRAVDARLAERGVVTIDAPVAGGRERAFAGKLAVMAGGEAAAFDRAAPVLRSYGDPVVRLGPVGSGQVAKILNNALMICNMQMADSALTLARAMGLDGAAVGDLLLHASASSTALGLLVAHDSGARTAHAGGPGIITKDIGLFQALCATSGQDAGALGTVGAAAAARAARLLRLEEGEG